MRKYTSLQQQISTSPKNFIPLRKHLRNPTLRAVLQHWLLTRDPGKRYTIDEERRKQK